MEFKSPRFPNGKYHFPDNDSRGTGINEVYTPSNYDSPSPGTTTDSRSLGATGSASANRSPTSIRSPAATRSPTSTKSPGAARSPGYAQSPGTQNVNGIMNGSGSGRSMPRKSSIKPGKRRSTTMNEQTFVPLSMRALYYCLSPSPDTEMVEPIPDGPASPKPRRFSNPGNELVLDPEFPTPQPSSHQYLLKVQTAAFCQDEMRLAEVLNPQKTTPQIPLHSVCGTVISTPTEDHMVPGGPKFKIGDTVFGVMSYTRDGGAADYALATEEELALKPSNIGAQEAAALALPGLTAWQALFRYAEIDPDAPSDKASGEGMENGHRDRRSGYGSGSGSGKSPTWRSGNGSGTDQQYGNGSGNGDGRQRSWIRKSMDGLNNRFESGQEWLKKNGIGPGNGNGNENGNGNKNGSTNGNGANWIKRLSTASGLYGYGGNGNGHRPSLAFRNGNGMRKKRSPLQLRVLITNARDSEVGRLAVQLLRAEMLFPHHVRPWICVTCSPVEEHIVRQEWDVDQVIVLPHMPAASEFDFGKIFRARRLDPVDVVLDCTGGVVFRQAHSPAVVKEFGAVLTAVDPYPAQEPANADPYDVLGRRKRGLRSRFVPVNPDSKALARIVELVESNMLRGRPETVVDLIHADRLLKDHGVGAGAARQGEMMVIRVN
ncbi:hypothetical protein N7462_007287 [Penicillium macrosclerotiorum]|uniref:uncharacterized protein n=1 Tax=Penicillium macrosclerotiorum TaxID=303699 RepID=UPI002546F80D|nr:uncharacterized protein N7462_007287 [Penicillium macrosclerotiorum]KAJ5679043.1 hypothetical protein N7462_007287 [Penicillium macrosclerotiorum]